MSQSGGSPLESISINVPASAESPATLLALVQSGQKTAAVQKFLEITTDTDQLGTLTRLKNILRRFSEKDRTEALDALSIQQLASLQKWLLVLENRRVSFRSMEAWAQQVHLRKKSLEWFDRRPHAEGPQTMVLAPAVNRRFSVVAPFKQQQPPQQQQPPHQKENTRSALEEQRQRRQAAADKQRAIDRYVSKRCAEWRAHEQRVLEKQRERSRAQAVALKRQRERHQLVQACSSPAVRLAQAKSAVQQLDKVSPIKSAAEVGCKLIPFRNGCSAETPHFDLLVHNRYVISCKEFDLATKKSDNSYSDLGMDQAASSLGIKKRETVRAALERVEKRFRSAAGQPTGHEKIHKPRGVTPWAQALPAWMYESIRLIVQQEHFRVGKPLVLGDLHERIRNDPELDFPYGKTVLWHVLRSMGYRRRKGLGGKHVLYEDPRIIRMRADYLRLKRQLESAMPGRQIIFVDESWLDSADPNNMCWHDLAVTHADMVAPGKKWRQAPHIRRSSYKRLMIISALSDDGLIPGSSVVWAVDEEIPSLDPHRNMSSAKFERYLSLLLELPGVRPDCLLVLDNAQYHKALLLDKPGTTMASAFEYVDLHARLPEHKAWAAAYKRATPKARPKAPEVHAMARAVRKSAGFKTDRMAKAHWKNCTLVWLVPYHPCLNPIENAWSMLKHRIFSTRGNKKYSTEQMKTFVSDILHHMETDEEDKQKLKNTFDHVAKVEQGFINDDKLNISPQVAPLIIEYNPLESEESESDSDMDDDVMGTQ